MTSKERARGVVDYWYDGTNVDEDTKSSMARVIEMAIGLAVAEAVAAEREACAKVADAGDAAWAAHQTIADAIRARGVK